MADIALTPLKIGDTDALFRFEKANREWFAFWVGPRPAAYDHASSLHDLIRAQIAGPDLMYLIKSKDGAILGRLNLTDITGGTAKLGYRIGKTHSGQGLATRAVKLAISQARAKGFSAIEVLVAEGNPASVQVLLKTGFSVNQFRDKTSVTAANGTELSLQPYRFLLDAPA